MRRAERVIVALAALGEARKAAAGPQGPDPVAAPGDDLVRIALVADVPHDLVARRVEHIMQRGGQLDDARSEERRVGTECVCTFRSRGSPYPEKKNLP